MRTIKELLKYGKKVYIVLPTKAMQYRFMSDAYGLASGRAYLLRRLGWSDVL